MAKFTFNMPDIGEGIAEAEIVQWHKQVGDQISEDEEFVDMMTDKATVPMERCGLVPVAAPSQAMAT